MDLEFARLGELWERLESRVRAAILVLAGVREMPPPMGRAARKFKRPRRHEAPEWLPMALNLLRDAGVYMTTREIARRLGVAHSTLVRNATFKRAREAFDQPVRKVVRRGPVRKG